MIEQYKEIEITAYQEKFFWDFEDKEFFRKQEEFFWDFEDREVARAIEEEKEREEIK